jgi:hypothetical protein
MITVILVTGQANDHNDANGLELTTYGGSESPRIRLLRDRVGLSGREVHYKLADVERLVVSPDVEVGPVGDYVPVGLVAAAGEQGQQAE